ncbi:MAG TPA: ABC transporter substrate-binding protein [Acetobacteraceae bacterium]|jgi:peptide/nickel transport system substrate-binding protein|nr:ABC transporter substrate-binding protein [Acetobacteraceae bacterium]
MQRRSLLKAGAGLLAAPGISTLGLSAFGLATPAIAQKAQVLRFVPQANLTLLDPIQTTATVTANHAYYVFDTLYSMGPDGVSRPQMAEGHSVSADKRVWTIKLRQGLKFHDGEPVRAADCIASIQRWMVPDPFGQLLADAVDSFKVVDDRSFQIRLKRPFPLLTLALGKPDARIPFIMPERLAKTSPSKGVAEMIGSGPYRFIAKDYVSGSKMAYEKFADYVPRSEKVVWATGAKIAYFPRIEWTIIPDAATTGAALQSGEIDWWEQPLADLLPQLARDKSISLQVDQPWGRGSYIRTNDLQAPFNNAKVRRAVQMAVRQEDYMRATFGDDESLWRTCKDVFPVGTPYYTGQDADLMKGDQKLAAQMLKESGYNGEKVVIINPTDFPQIHPLGVVTADTLKKIGMNVDLQETDWGTVVQRRTKMDAVENGGWSIFHSFSSASSMATPATSGILTAGGKKGWFGWWDNPEAVRLTEEWLNAPDEAAQKQVAHALSHVAMTDVATVVVGQWFGKTAFRNSITGVLQGVAPYPWNVRPA